MVLAARLIGQLVPDGYKCRTVSRPAQKRGGGVAVNYKSGLKVEIVTTRNKFTPCGHAGYYVTARGVTFRLCHYQREMVSLTLLTSKLRCWTRMTSLLSY